ncbi:MAG TPA: sigma-70 family RNA polymerase sigma factor [Candidatus Acidoferrales bacterium]|nr:sigma-70 family RNA polymerase sigma factor [Candidatus Acidoferrales bacterium]
MTADAPYPLSNFAVERAAQEPRSAPDQATDLREAGAAADQRDIAACRRGDRAAFGRLYTRYSRLVHGILLARVPYSDVEDLVHDVFLQALRHLSALRSPEAFGGWVATIARRRAQDYFRRSHAASELPDEISQAPAPHHEAAAALAAIRALPEAYRETLILRLVEGMSGPEISARTGLTPGSVRVNLHRGMALLRKSLGLEEQP